MSSEIERYDRPDHDPVVALRLLMGRVREAQQSGVSGYEIASADYETEARPTNQHFLDQILQLLPVSTRFGDEEFRVPKPEHVLATLALGTALLPARKVPLSVFVLGERAESARSTRLLLSLPELTYPPSAPGCMEVSVSTAGWRARRARALGHLTAPNPDLIGRMSEKGGYEVGISELVQLQEGPVQATGPISYRFATGNVIRARDLSPKRGLRCVDFTNFNVPYHLSVLAAAYGVSEQYDALVATREAALPPAPEEAMFGLEGYRAITEAVHFDE